MKDMAWFSQVCTQELSISRDLSTDSFINALRCFISLRGAVRQLHCDQGSNFVGARNEFKEALIRHQATGNFPVWEAMWNSLQLLNIWREMFNTACMALPTMQAVSGNGKLDLFEMCGMQPSPSAHVDLMKPLSEHCCMRPWQLLTVAH